MADIPEDVAAALAEVPRITGAARDPWWIIGSAAALLHGAETNVGDIDLLMSVRDARAVLGAGGAAARPGGGSDLFHSDAFGTIHTGALAIEVMGGLKVRTSDGWQAVALATRRPVRLGAATLLVPERAELIDLLRLFGRDKDVARAGLLAALPGA